MRVPELRAGEIVALRWRIGKLVGIGDMSRAYQADDTQRFQSGVLKLFGISGADQQAAWSAYLEAERRAHALIPALTVANLDTGEYRVLRYSVVEPVPWPNLETVANQAPLTPARWASVLRALLPILETAHDSGLIHRSLKPTNIFIEPGDTPAIKLSDFGVSALRAAAPPMPCWGATPGWLGPDAADPASPSTVAMDVCALGLVSFFALTGVPPYKHLARAADKNPSALWQAMTRPLGSAQDLARKLGTELSIEADGWFAKAWAPQPKARFASVRELVEAYEEILASSPQAHEAAPPPRPRPPPLPAKARPPALPSQTQSYQAPADDRDAVAGASTQPLAYLPLPKERAGLEPETTDLETEATHLQPQGKPVTPGIHWPLVAAAISATLMLIAAIAVWAAYLRHAPPTSEPATSPPEQPHFPRQP